MPEKSIIVIGAGIAGLSAGCYGRMNGYRVRIFEQNTRPGGLCTSWERKGYTINGGLAFLGGSGPAVGLYRIWEELGVVPKIMMIDYACFVIVEGKEGQRFVMYTDLDSLERHMKDLAPEDEKTIETFIGAVRIFTEYQLPLEKAQELMTPYDKIKFIITHFPLFRNMMKWRKISIRDFSNRFKNPFLREAFFQAKAIFSDDLPMTMIFLLCAWSHLKSAGYPEGGALRFARAIEMRFCELGGKVVYNSRVDKIMIEDNKTVGIRLTDGIEHRSDYVISAADGRSTLFGMLDGKFIDQKIRSCYDNFPVTASVLCVAFGCDRRFPDIPHSGVGLIYPLKEPVNIGGIEVKTLRPMIYNFDPSLAPEGKTLLRVVLPADYDYWAKINTNPDDYKAEKEKAAAIVLRLLEQRFPGISADVVMSDVATPLTFERYTGSWKGSIIGWDLTTATAKKDLPKTLSGLKNFWMAGQWLEPGGGVPMVTLSGRNVIQLIARADKKPFITAI
ncbi:MAG: NAD(P)/FAD-dependent oxidoreductase [Candidatus Aminicenantes bacterium]|nr:NAD(P)/FAD-dependent oxidoreductase [Candidatus Aminicenantes bacterium]